VRARTIVAIIRRGREFFGNTERRYSRYSPLRRGERGRGRGRGRRRSDLAWIIIASLVRVNENVLDRQDRRCRIADSIDVAPPSWQPPVSCGISLLLLPRPPIPAPSSSRGSKDVITLSRMQIASPAWKDYFSMTNNFRAAVRSNDHPTDWTSSGRYDLRP